MAIPRTTIKLLSMAVLVLFITDVSRFSFSQPQGKTHSYMTSDFDEISGKSFDYIIIGGGTAGCPLAATLSEKFSVLLIERGESPYQNPKIMQKNYYGFPLLETDEYTSVSQSFISRDGVTNHRGRVLGGSSSINGGFYSRASSDFVKKAGWDEEMVEESFKWVESRVMFVPELTPWQFTAQFGLMEAGLGPYNGFSLEHKEGTKIGGTIFDRFGVRHSSADLLAAGNSDNLTVLLGATAKNIVFYDRDDKNETRACGVSFIKSDGTSTEPHTAFLNRGQDNSTAPGDVVLTSGALGSPQLLLLSGIGPSKHLNRFNISITTDLKWVGREMKDNPCIAVLADTQPQNRIPDPPQVAGVSHDLDFIVEAGVLPITTNLTRVPVAAKYAFPISKGRLKLNNIDPRHNPSVKFNYLENEADLQQCVEMVALLQRVVTSQAVSAFLDAEHKGNILIGQEDVTEFCRKNVRTYFHYHGGCTMGLVVDEDYKVFGVAGLRVVDGSTFVESPGTNPMATVMMLGRYQGLRMIQERVASSV